MRLDANKIYAVATTDYISAGDTGYPDLASKALNPKDHTDKFPERLIPISGLVCHSLFWQPETSLPYCVPDLKIKNYLDPTSLTAESTGAPPTLGSKLPKFFNPTEYK